MVKPYFSPEISLGNLIQVISVVTMIGGGAITSYVSLRNDIAVSGERSGKAIADVNARVLVLEARRAKILLHHLRNLAGLKRMQVN